MADAAIAGKNGEPVEDLGLDDVETMEDLVKEMGEDKIERKQNRPARRPRQEKATEEVVEETTAKEE